MPRSPAFSIQHEQATQTYRLGTRPRRRSPARLRALGQASTALASMAGADEPAYMHWVSADEPQVRGLLTRYPMRA
ncbi:hypothetical protein [Streptosporangium sp. NPDC087985]|uniref:hypothetical protein n=1 Tax=Streptosporangium sp. NPDC087985 TaxID=3366196 RepID=UPI00381F017F